MTLGCAAAGAHAQSFFQIEAGIGGAGYSDGGDGYWQQDRFEHKLQLTAPAFEVGITGDLYQTARWGISYHVDWAWLGTIHTQSLATPSDTNYNPSSTTGCNGKCWPLANYQGSGHAQAFVLTLEPHYDVGQWRFGIEAGPTLTHATWTEDVSGWVSSPTGTPVNLHVVSTDGWRLGAVVGASVSRGAFSVAYQHFFMRPSGANPAPPIWHSVDLLMARYKF